MDDFCASFGSETTAFNLIYFIYHSMPKKTKYTNTYHFRTDSSTAFSTAILCFSSRSSFYLPICSMSVRLFWRSLPRDSLDLRIGIRLGSVFILVRVLDSLFLGASACS